MIAEFTSRVVEGFLAPRASARRLLDGGHGWDTAILLFLLGYVLTAIFASLFAPAIPEQTLIGRHVSGLFMAALMVAIVSSAAWQFGRISGGKASFQDMVMVMSWQQVITSFLTPFLFQFSSAMSEGMRVVEDQMNAGAQPELPPLGAGVMLGGVAAIVLSLWLLASYIAEAHQFKGTLGVLGVIIGLPFVLAMIIVLGMGGG